MLIATASFLSLIVIVLAMPVTLTYRLSWKETLAANARLTWLFGLVRADVSPDLEKAATGRPEGTRKKAGWWRKSRGRRTNVMAAIRQPAFRQRLFRFVSDAWRAIHKKNVQLLVRLGLGDPADTGQLWGVLGPIAGIVARPRDVRITIEPDFLESTLEVDSSGTIRMIPLQFLILALGLLFSPPIWRGLILMRTSG